MNDRLDARLLADREHDEDLNASANPSFLEVLDARLSRRSLLRGGVGGAAAAVLGSVSLAACGGRGDDEPIESLGFQAVPKSRADVVTVPAGYTATVLYALGDPLDAATPDYRNDGSDGDFDRRAGDHHDGMEYFGLSRRGQRDDFSNSRALLVMNHEATTDQFLHPAGVSARPRPLAEVEREVPVHGVSIVEIRKGANGSAGGNPKGFATVRDSAFNRRITPLTPVQIAGPARGNALLRTKYSPDGTATRGTLNNCGTGKTPWGTYLTGEENWAGYFTRAATDNAARGNDRSVASLNRYGRAQGATSRHGWETAGSEDRFARWDISQRGTSADGSDDYRNELNGFGYIVEIDPYDPKAAIKKRTALGRFAHESASFGKLRNGRPVAVYMGDDSRGEYIYKFVSARRWERDDERAAALGKPGLGDKFLDEGVLYVAKFDADGSGRWIALDIADPSIAGYAGYAFADQADVLVNARLAADAVGATKMDRPEWCAVHPGTGEIYYTLTNNSNRKLEPTNATQFALDAANPRSYADSFGGAPAGAPGNVNGHIIRLSEDDERSDATAFRWDVYLFGAQADADGSRINLSSLTDAQDFSSPDGLVFSRSTGLAWIQTDDGSYTDVTNCMMLAGVPGQVGDGQAVRLDYTKADGSTLQIETFVGQKPAVDTLKRFLVGPVDCELTGCCETPDGTTMFVNIQHPGETISAANVADPSKYLSHWPGNAGYGAGGATARPRSATLAITKDDGGRIGE